jgi:hypothetical protein
MLTYRFSFLKMSGYFEATCILQRGMRKPPISIKQRRLLGYKKKAEGLAGSTYVKTTAF